MKPSVISHLQKDKSIYAIDGYVDTQNWVNDTVSNLKADKGLKIRWIDDNHPLICKSNKDEEADNNQYIAGISISIIEDSETIKFNALYV